MSLRTLEGCRYQEAQAYIERVKAADCYWSYRNETVNACRDAISQGDEAIVRLFLDNGMSPYARSTKDEELAPSLIDLAAKVGKLSIVKILGSYDTSGNSRALCRAIEEGHDDIVQYFLEQGEDPNGSFDSNVPQSLLSKAALEGHKRTVDLLVQYGANKIEIALAHNESQLVCRTQKYLYETMQLDGRIETKNEQSALADYRQFLQQYTRSVQILLDHATGVNLHNQHFGSGDALSSLAGLDVAGLNFLGVSVEGHPVTWGLLIDKGVQGVYNAIITEEDLLLIKDNERQKTLQARLQKMFESQGKLISREGVVNLVPLAEAAEQGDLDAVRTRLSAGADPNQKTTSRPETSALIVAAVGDYFEIVKLLAEHPNIDPKDRFIASQEVQKRGYTQIVEYLSQLQENIDINALDHEGNALIHKAVKTGDVDRVKYLLSKKVDVHRKNSAGLSPIETAIDAVIARFRQSRYHGFESHIAIIRILLTNGADPKRYDRHHDELLVLAAKRGSYNALSSLLSMTTRQPRSFEHTFVLEGEEKTVTRPWYVSLLRHAHNSKEWIKILELFLEHGANLNTVYGEEDHTLLHELVTYLPLTGHDTEYNKRLFDVIFKRLDFLLKNGADPNIAYGLNKRTVLHIFVANTRMSSIEGAIERIMSLLIGYGADVKARDTEGRTPLHEAVRARNVKAETYLLELGGSPDILTTNA